MTTAPPPLSEIQLPVEVLCVFHTLQAAGHEASLVGGAVRDLLSRSARSTAITDYDFTTSALPEQIQALFPESFYDNEFGTVGIAVEHLQTQFSLPPVPDPQPSQIPADRQRIIDVAKASKLHSSLHQSKAGADLAQDHSSATLQPFQITTYRSDGLYHDKRRPESVTWGVTLAGDLERRDFTINAMALQLEHQWVEATCSSLIDRTSAGPIDIPSAHIIIVDPFNGRDDQRAGVIHTVGDPTARFQEDALRLLRAVRFSVQLDMQIESATADALTANAALLSHISGERIRDEFLKIISSDHPKHGIELLDEHGLLQYIIPELLEAKGINQSGHHTTDVWTHSLDALDTCPSRDSIVRLATLLHDIAKPRTYRAAGGHITFYNHEVVGAHLAKEIGWRLRLSRAEIDRLFVLVRFHMFHYQPTMTDAAIRRFMRKVGLEYVDDILDLREGDRLGSGARKTSWRLEEMKQRMIEQLHQPLDVTDLAINGHDLMTELGLQPGPLIGQLLHQLFEVVLEKPELNHRDELLRISLSLIHKQVD